MIKRVDHIDIAVKDVDRATKLFEKMGFKLVRRTTHGGGNGSAELKLPGANQIIFELFPVMPQFLDGKPGVRHVALLVDDAQKTFDELKAKGIRSYQEKPGFIPETGRILFNCEDDDLGTFAMQFQEEEKNPSVSC